MGTKFKSLRPLGNELNRHSSPGKSALFCFGRAFILGSALLSNILSNSYGCSHQIRVVDLNGQHVSRKNEINTLLEVAVWDNELEMKMDAVDRIAELRDIDALKDILNSIKQKPAKTTGDWKITEYVLAYLKRLRTLTKK